jgi:biotin synthase
MDAVCDAVARMKRENLPLSICASLGSLDEERALRLRRAGVDRVNHNLEAAPSVFERLCTTHSHEERLTTARAVKAVGLELCSGGLVGLGETLEERAELALLLREVGADAVPVNFFDPRPGTPLAGAARISANDALRALAMFRFVIPHAEIRMAGGREKSLGPMQALGLYAADSMFTEGYLTTAGQGFEADMAMIAAAGFEIAGTLE